MSWDNLLLGGTDVRRDHDWRRDVQPYTVALSMY